MTTIAEIDTLTQQLYTSGDSAARQQAMAVLEATSNEGADLGLFHTILQQSSSQYTLLFAAQSLVRWFKNNAKYLDAGQQHDLIVNRCGQCLQRIAVADAPRHVTMSLVAMYAKLTKYTFEKEPFLKEAVVDVIGLLGSTYAQCEASLAMSADGSSSNNTSTPNEGGGGGSIQENQRLYFLALLLLDGLVLEFSKYDSSKSQTFMNFAAHRRSSNNFRDECMLDMFKASLFQLERLTPKGMIVDVVELVKDCLTFDFMAIMVDETEEALSAQFPSTWKECILDQRTQEVLWAQHRALPFPHCDVVLTGLTSICGIRRTFFETAEDRLAYINLVLGRVIDILNNPPDSRLTIPRYVNSLAEACLRVIAPFGYRDLHQSPCFVPWVQAAYRLSAQVISTPFGKDGSFTTATTLMNFWSRLCTSRRMYAGVDEPPSELEQLSPMLSLDIFSSRVHLSGAAAAADGGSAGGSSTPPGAAGDLALIETLMDDMDGAMEAVLSQAEALAAIAILDQKASMGALAGYARQQLGPAVLNSPLASGWLFFLAGSLAKHVLNNIDDAAVEACGGFFMFCVDCANHRRLSGGDGAVTLSSDPETNAALSNFVERGLLYMLANMQSVFSSIRHQSALSLIVTSIFQSKAQLFQFILNNTGGNMMRSPNGTADEETAAIMRSSLELIGEAIRDVPQSILTELAFDLPPVVQLPLSQSINTYKLRTALYHILWPLTLVNRSNSSGGSASVKYSREVLMRFIRPIQTCMQTTMTSAEGTSPIYVAGWLRDLRGVALALQDDPTHGHEAFSDLIEWFCDDFSLFESVIASPVGESPIVTTSFLRLLIELVNSRGGRMTLPGTGNHTILGLSLFKNICMFLRQIVQRCITEEKIQAASQSSASADTAYDLMMKPLSLAMTCMRRCVGDSFVPLGAMWYYKDDTYDTTLLGLLRMLGVFPVALFKSYGEATFTVVDLLRTICEDDAYQPLARLGTADLRVIVNFAIAVCEDTETQTGTLIHGLSFLGFIAGFVKDVKALSMAPALNAGTSPMMASAGQNTPPPHLSPMMQHQRQPQFYSLPGSGRLSGTPGGKSNSGGGAGHPPSHMAREARASIARALEPMSDLWLKLIEVGMNVITLQDRAMSASCGVVYPIMEAFPPFWQQFVDGFVAMYPSHKQQRLREALSTLFNDSPSSDRFFSEVFTFRQTLRSL